MTGGEPFPPVTHRGWARAEAHVSLCILFLRWIANYNSVGIKYNLHIFWGCLDLVKDSLAQENMQVIFNFEASRKVGTFQSLACSRY